MSWHLLHTIVFVYTVLHNYISIQFFFLLELVDMEIYFITEILLCLEMRRTLKLNSSIASEVQRHTVRGTFTPMGSDDWP